MKQLLKKILILNAIIIVVISNISANKSNWSGMYLTSDDIANSVHFQLARGSNSTGEFKKIQPILDRFLERKLDSKKLTNILGKPNSQSSLRNMVCAKYFLTENTADCSVELFIENDNLVSYHLENCK